MEPKPTSSEEPELVVAQPVAELEEPYEERDVVSSPSKVIRIGSMIRTLLEEARNTSLDEASRVRLKDIYESAIRELAEGVSADLADELRTFSMSFTTSEVPSEAELRIAQAQLVGWLEGLFHGIQATLFAQQAGAHNQLEEIRRQMIPAHTEDSTHRTGTYL